MAALPTRASLGVGVKFTLNFAAARPPSLLAAGAERRPRVTVAVKALRHINLKQMKIPNAHASTCDFT